MVGQLLSKNTDEILQCTAVNLAMANSAKHGLNIYWEHVFTKAMFSSKKFSKFPVISNVWHMHGALNVDEKTNYIVW
jgi:hypothetical protein